MRNAPRSCHVSLSPITADAVSTRNYFYVLWRRSSKPSSRSLLRLYHYSSLLQSWFRELPFNLLHLSLSSFACVPSLRKMRERTREADRDKSEQLEMHKKWVVAVIKALYLYLSVRGVGAIKKIKVNKIFNDNRNNSYRPVQSFKRDYD